MCLDLLNINGKEMALVAYACLFGRSDDWREISQMGYPDGAKNGNFPRSGPVLERTWKPPVKSGQIHFLFLKDEQSFEKYEKTIFQIYFTYFHLTRFLFSGNIK